MRALVHAGYDLRAEGLVDSAGVVSGTGTMRTDAHVQRFCDRLTGQTFLVDVFGKRRTE